MTSLAFDIPAASGQPGHRGRRRTVSVLDVLRHPVLDVLNLDTTPATTCENGPLAGNSRLCGPFFLCPVVSHLVALWTAVSRHPRTYGGRRPCPWNGRCAPLAVLRTATDGPRQRGVPARPGLANSGDRGRIGDRVDDRPTRGYRARRRVPMPCRKRRACHGKRARD